MFSQYRISWYISLPIWIHSVMVDMTDNCPFDCQFKHLHLWRMLHLDRQKNSSCSDQDRVLKECIWEMGFKKQDENSFFAIVYDYFFFFSKWSMRQVLWHLDKNPPCIKYAKIVVKKSWRKVLFLNNTRYEIEISFTVNNITEVSASNWDHSEAKKRSINAIFSSKAEHESRKWLTKLSKSFSLFSRNSRTHTLIWWEEQTVRSASILNNSL